MSKFLLVDRDERKSARSAREWPARGGCRCAGWAGCEADVNALWRLSISIVTKARARLNILQQVYPGRRARTSLAVSRLCVAGQSGMLTLCDCRICRRAVLALVQGERLILTSPRGGAASRNVERGKAGYGQGGPGHRRGRSGSAWERQLSDVGRVISAYCPACLCACLCSPLWALSAIAFLVLSSVSARSALLLLPLPLFE